MNHIRIEPGSEAARLQGCICDPASLQPSEEGVFIVEKMCPVHGLAELHAALKEENDGSE